MGFQQGLSGLTSADTSLSVIGNNVANASTVGFKDSRAEFADIYANSLNGAGAPQVGLGSQVSTVAQQFTQGGITVDSNPLDIAINGGGFFRMSNNGAISYTRNGQFQLDKNGFIVNATGLKLQGYQATNGVIANVLSNIQLPTSGSIAPQVTGGSAAGTGVTAQLNLNSGLAAPTVPVFAYGNASSYNNSTAISVYDSLGNAHTYTMYFAKASAGNAFYQAALNAGATVAQVTTAKAVADAVAGAGGTNIQAAAAAQATISAGTAVAASAAIAAVPGLSAAQIAAGQAAVTGLPNANFTATAAQGNAGNVAGAAVAAGQWNVYATVANPAGASQQFTDLSGGGNNPTPLTNLVFSTSGVLTSPASGIVSQNITAAQLGSLGINAAGLTYNVNFSGSTQFGAGFVVNDLKQDGYASGTLAGFNVGSDGIIVGNYTNGVTQDLGQVTLDTFKNDQGLQDIGNNQYVETSKSGNPISGQTPGSGSVGVLQASATEDSNVDLTKQLVDMIVAQRVYQANAQTIKVEDQILQTLVNLR